MAAIVQQQQAQEMSAARAFWNDKMQKHPNIAGALAIAGEVAGFFVNGHCIVTLARWIIRVSGYIAESALLFAVLWISATSVAPHLIELVMDAKTMQYFVSVALIALALIPEVILANAIVNALGHVHTAVQKRNNVTTWIWAGLFILPTIMFLVLTAITLNTLTSNGGNFVEASKNMLGFRCFAGWSYGLLEMVYAGVGRRMVQSSAQLQVTPVVAAPTAQPQPAIQIDYQEVARHLQPMMQQEVEPQLQQLRSQLQEVAALFLTQSATQNASESDTEDDTENTLEHENGSDTNATECATADDTEQCNNITQLSAARRTTTRTKSNTVTRSEKARKAASIIKRNPQISAPDLAKKAQISASYARQLLAKQA